MLGITRENLTGSRVIRAFNKEQDEIAQFHEDNEALTKIQLYVGKISALMNPLTYIIINGAIVVLVWVGAIRVDNGNITQGQVVALVSYMSQILVELIKLANLIININKSIACMNRIETVLDMESSITEHPAAETRRDHRYYRRNRFWKIFGRESDSAVLRCDQRRGSRRREECAGLYIGGTQGEGRCCSAEGGSL